MSTDIKNLIAKKTRDHAKLAGEAKKLSDSYEGEDMPPHVGKEFAQKVDEAKALQVEIKELERKEQLGDLDGFQREIPSTPLPDSAKSHEGNGDVEGYLTPGQEFVGSDDYLNYIASGMPKNGGVLMTKNASWHGEDSFIPLTRKAARERRERLEQKALPTLSASNATTFAVIQPQRLSQVVRTYEFERLTIRDLVTKMNTSVNSIEFPRLTSALPTAATTVSDALTGSNVKPESTLALDVATAPVRALAVHMPVTEQQLADFPQIRAIIDSFLRFDILRLEEYQMIWGDGTGTDLLGIMETPNVTAATRTPDMGAGTTVTLLDKIRVAMTDIQVNNLEPNGLVVHPIDWEEIQLQKGSDDHYLRQVFPTEEGGYRVFSLRVVPTIATQNYRSGLSADQRVVIVGNFSEGAVLWDRQMLSVDVGYIDKQFIQNTRTIRAEERVGFAVWKPFAFKYIETQAAGT